MFILPELPFGYSALEPYIDETTMKVHHDGHHNTYVNKLNEALKDYPDLQNLTIEQLLIKLNQTPKEVRLKIQNNGGGHGNHSLFWKTIGPNGGGQPSNDLAQAINQNFESFDKFKEQFNLASLNLFGSGWTWLVKDSANLKIITTTNQDSPLSQGLTPLLNLDLWEHAYYLKYQSKRADYIEAWWNVVDWQEINQRYLKES